MLELVPVMKMMKGVEVLGHCLISEEELTVHLLFGSLLTEHLHLLYVDWVNAALVWSALLCNWGGPQRNGRA